MRSLSLLLCALTACGPVKGVGCDDLGLMCDTWSIWPDSDTLPDGEHVLTLDLDGEVVTCTLTLPEGSIGCDADGVRLNVGASGMSEPYAWSLQSIELEAQPEHVTLTWTWDGVLVASDAWDVVPEDMDEDGDPPECDSPCFGWSTSLHVTF